MLESLRQGAGNIHQLNLEGAFPKPAVYRPRELYEELKRTPLYNAERGKWNWLMSEEPGQRGTDRYIYAQLLGVLAEALFNPKAAQALHERLKATPLYDAQHGQWNWFISEEQELDDADRASNAQLLGVLVVAQFNPEGARTLFEKLKATPLYDADREQWNWRMSKEQELIATTRDADTQLLGVLAEAQFNPAGAQAFYERLKTTPLYDGQRGQWNFYMFDKQELKSTSRYAHCQLLGVLVEAQFNPNGARALYEELKATPLYDAQRRQCNWLMSEKQELKDSDRLAYAQLLGVLVETQFNSEGARALYERLKATPLYDAQHGQWNLYMSKEQELRGTHRYAHAQLLGVLVEAQFNPEGARALYEKLKATPLYDAQRGQWNFYMSKEQELRGTHRYAHAQLLGVLVEAQFNPEGARALYEKLKATPLYDAPRGQWNWWISTEQDLSNTDRGGHVQLLGVLMEAKLLATLPRPLSEAIPPLPITEDW